MNENGINEHDMNERDRKHDRTHDRDDGKAAARRTSTVTLPPNYAGLALLVALIALVGWQLWSIWSGSPVAGAAG